ncbi:beta-lactamase class A [Erythromicrobium ramosum]|uniref:beta-lactamase n=1 Tax=Erythrobacter ramosus TaxID=35811 RepID=A0A6I4UHX0_9SPHN|nr:class A beta-lactamase [Erythrobacter ramosus]MBB3774264.1 beta-lactamase class A [Erythrobacter ramosus]MXP38078.1 class A beta-lactamase [Erythrobacter ramosus]
MKMDRRHFIGGTLALGASACIPPDQSPMGQLAAELRIIEAAGDGTLGVELFDTVSGMSVGLNRDRRFGHASSFKFSLAALLLQRHAAGQIDADKRVTWTEADMLEYAPFTRERIGAGATLRELARATQTTSDNPAANILLRNLGGPAGLTAFWRSMGDEVSRVDRYEPEMNIVPPAEFRDTATPAAMARNVAKIIYGDVLPEAERAELKGWMIATETGLRRVRAGLPEGWVAGDKTGTSGMVGTEGNYIDIGFAEGPKGQPPITFACYFRARQAEGDMAARAELTLSRVGRIIKEFAEPERGLPVIGKLY